MNLRYFLNTIKTGEKEATEGGRNNIKKTNNTYPKYKKNSFKYITVFSKPNTTKEN